MLTLAAFHVLNDTSDPYFTSLQAGQYDQHRPKGRPCDAAYPCSGPELPKGGKIAMAVILTVVGLTIVGLGSWWLWLLHKNRSDGKTG